jgi:hypothetical protein
MYEIAEKFRSALRWLIFMAGGLAFAAAAFALLLPFLIEGRTVRESFIRSLSAWSGGPVIVNGPLRIASFTTLSIEASDVRLPQTGRLDPVRQVNAKSVTGVARLSSLFRGKLEFKKIVVSSPRLIFKRNVSQTDASSNRLEIAGMTAALADRSPFEQLELRDSAFFMADGVRLPYRRTEVEQIRLGKGAPASITRSGLETKGPNSRKNAITLYLKDRNFEALFRGELDGMGETALGKFRLKASLDNPAARRITAATAPWEWRGSASLTGDLNWSRGRAALDNATMTFGDHSAKGSLALAMTQGRLLLEGTLAYDRLDFTPGVEEIGEKNGGAILPLAALSPPRFGKHRSLDLDMRISAERFRAGAFEAGPLAIALTSRGDRVSVDIAELALFGGSVTGRIGYDPAQPAAISLSASGLRIDSSSFAGALGLPLNIGGPVTIQAGLKLPLTNKPLGEDSGLAGSFAVKFPAGGTLDGEVSRKLSAALAHRELSWGPGASSFAFTAASIDGTIRQNGIDLSVDGQSASGHISGSLRVAFPGSIVSGTLSLSQDGEAPGAPASASTPVASSNSTNILLSGTATALTFSPSGKSSLSN